MVQSNNPLVELWYQFLGALKQSPLVIEAQRVSEGRGGEIYHGELIAYIAHSFILNTVAQGATLTYTNRTGKIQYIQSLSISGVGGTPTVSLQIGDEFYTASPAATGSGVTLQETDFSLAVDVTDAASTEQSEIALGPNQSIILKVTGGTGSVACAFKLAQGVA
jgi:hypothetical protein